MIGIWVVEDEPSLRDDLVEFLAGCGFAVQGFASAAALRAALAGSTPPAIVILDIGLPDGNGFDLAREIRSCSDCGIVMLTARGEPEDRIHGLRQGADIYLVKDTSLREIEASLSSLLRRLGQSAPAEPKEAWLLDQVRWQLLSPDGTAMALTATELGFLSILLERPGQPCSRDMLVRKLARIPEQWDSRHLDAVVARLRRKIRRAGHPEAPIRMVYGLGYAFSAPARVEA